GEESASVEGISTLKMNLSTQGDRPSMLKRQLQGDIDLKLERGKLHDKKFAEKLEALAALVEKRRARDPDEVVVFDLLEATWKAEQGIMRNDDLRLNTLLLNFRGEGDINLPDEHIAYALTPVVAGKSRDLLLAPITIEGALSEPQYGLDLTHFTRDQLQRSKTQLGEGFKEQTERLGTGVRELGGGIKYQFDSGVEAVKGLFRRDE
ncbi:MAG: AsmA-like C-terminal region-containing protein, partial [Gammaproteobacteria bacterium]|nr:AsmA-like C-terminal region-containing protein [Gammaproteobacteria bacterium]